MCQGGELNSRPRAYESPALPLSYPGVGGEKIESRNVACQRGQTCRSSVDLIFLLNVGREIFFAAAHRRHETNAIVFLHDPGPIFEIDVAPAGKVARCGAFWILLRRKQEKLHLLLNHRDLRDPMALIVVKDARSNSAKVGELGRNIVMLEPVLHEKQ